MASATPRNTTGPTYRRRAVLTMLAAGAGGAILAACGADQAPTAVPTAAPTAIRPTTGATTAAPAPAATTVAAAAPTTAPAAPTTAPTTVAAAATAAPTTAPIVAAATPAPAATSAPAAMTGGAAMPMPMAMPDANGKIAGGAPGVPDAYLKPPAPYKSVAMIPGKGSKVTLFLIAYNAPPVPHDQNTFWKEFEKRLGVSSFDMTLAPQANYNARVATAVAGGDLQDLFFLDLARVPEQNRTVQQGAFTDLTSELSGEGLKQYPNLAQFPPQIWKNSAVGGKIYGVPRPRALSSNTLLFRQDWADKLRLAPPKNADDFLNVMTAFTKMDPDGNGKADTYGMASKPDGTGIYGIDFYAGMFRLPNEWRKNPDGTLVNIIEVPEFKEMIAYMRRSFEAGIFHPDAATMTTVQGQDALVSGKVGTLWDSVQSTSSLRQRTKMTAGAVSDVVGFLPVGYDGGKATSRYDTGFFGITAIPARVGRDKERVKELLRIMDYIAAPFGSEERNFLSFGIEGMHHTIKDGNRVLNDVGRAEIGELNNQTNNVPTYYYPDAPQDAVLLQNLQRSLLAIAEENPTNGLVSATNAMKAAELRQLRIDRLNVIIQGREPLSALDTFVRDWRSRGGDAIRKEFQDALKG